MLQFLRVFFAVLLVSVGFGAETRKVLKAELSSGFASPAIDGILGYLSEEGDQAYLFYSNFYDTFKPTQPVAQLLNNVDGELVVSKTLPFDPKYPASWFGWASQDFSRFSVLQTAICKPYPACAPSIENMRIQILDNDFNVVGSRIIKNSNFSVVMGGSFSEDNHYVSFAYALAAPPPSKSFNSVIYVFDATDPKLPTVAGPITISGYDPLVRGPTLFTLTDSSGTENLYLSFANSQINLKAANKFSLDDDLRPPYFSEVYKVDVKKGTITLLDKKPLPKFAENTLFVRKSGKEALVCHGGQCSINPKQPQIYTTILPANICDLPGNCEAIRVFRFDGEKLKLFFKQSSNCCSFVVAYPPDNGCTYFIGQSVETYSIPAKPKTQTPFQQEFWSLHRLVRGNSGLKTVPEAGPFQDLKNAITTFSQNGKWMLRTGVYGYVKGKPNKDSIGIKNVLLFKISKEEVTPFCNK